MSLPDAETLARWCPGVRISLRRWLDATSLGVGLGSFVEARPSCASQVGELSRILFEEGMPWMVLGGGTNLVGMDEDYAGVVLNLRDSCAGMDVARGEVGAAVPLVRFLRAACDAGRGDLWRLSGIPGRIGGMLAMNAGALGQEIGERVRLVRGVLRGEPWEWHPTREAFGYRTCLMPAEAIVTSVQLELEETDGAAERQRIHEELLRRARVTPKGHSAGSVFRNPPEAPAGKLLEECGCKELRRGNLQVSEQHANWIVKTDNAPAAAADCRALCEEMRRRVLCQHGIELHCEWRWGDMAFLAEKQ